MAETKVIMPQMGESIFEGTITKWLKRPGDKIHRDEPLFEMSTDKVDSEIPSPASGTLHEILVQEGQTVQINTVVALIGDGPAKPAEASKETPGPDKAGTSVGAAPASTATPPAATDSDRARSSPLVRRIAREQGVDLNVLSGKGTGISGRITKSDILSYIARGGSSETAKAGKATEPNPLKFSSDVERVPLSAIRKSIAERMLMSQNTSAHVTTIFEVDVTRILQTRERLKSEFEQAGIHLTVTPFFVHAAVKALRKFPVVNSSLDGDTVVYKRAVNIGIAVNIEAGLIVPVIKNADEKSLQGLAHAIADLGDRARSKKLTPDDVKDSTFTITNPGQYGSLTATPIINQPNVAILGMGGIKKRPVVIDDAVAIRSIIYLALSFDHRVIDGATADQFMAEIQKELEHWPAE